MGSYKIVALVVGIKSKKIFYEYWYYFIYFWRVVFILLLYRV